MEDKWKSMNCLERCEVISSWPEDKPFFTDTLILDGDLNAALYECSQLKYLYLQSHDYKTIPDGILKSLRTLQD